MNLVGSDRTSAFNRAYDFYEQALKVNPEGYEAFNDWGIALSEEAKTLDSAARRSKLEEAVAKYQSALAIKPDDASTLNNWAFTLIHFSYLET